MQAAHDPISKPINVDPDLLVYLRAPAWQAFSLSNESIDRTLAHVANVVHRGLEVQTAVLHKDYNHIVRVSLGLFTIIGEDVLLLVYERGGSDHQGGRAYVRPRYEVVCGFSESLHNRVFHHLVWNIELVRVFDESPARFASACIPADSNVRIEIRDNPVPSILRLDCDGLEKEVHRRHETLLGTGATVLDQTFPVAERDRGQCFFFFLQNKGKRCSLSGEVGNASVALVTVGKI